MTGKSALSTAGIAGEPIATSIWPCWRASSRICSARMHSTPSQPDMAACDGTKAKLSSIATYMNFFRSPRGGMRSQPQHRVPFLGKGIAARHVVGVVLRAEQLEVAQALAGAHGRGVLAQGAVDEIGIVLIDRLAARRHRDRKSTR